MEEIDAKILEPVADKLKIKKSALPKLLIFWGVFGIVLNIFWLINSLYPLPRLLSLDTEPSFWWQYVLYIFFIVLSAMELVYGLKLNRQEKQLRKNQKFNALFLLLFPLFLSILLSPLSVISTLHFFAQKKPITEKPIPKHINVSPVPSPNPIHVQPINTNWKTYTNTVYKFSIQYPNTWSYIVSPPHNDGQQIVFGPDAERLEKRSGGDIEVVIYNKNNDYGFKESYLSNLQNYIKNNFYNEQIKTYTLNGTILEEVHDKGTCPTNNDCITVVFKKGNNVYTFHPWIWSLRYQDLAIIYQMISTLKFTE